MGRARSGGPVKPVKKISRTAGFKVVGVCGHEYPGRTSLWPIYGVPVNEETLKQKDKIVANAKQALLGLECYECVARKSLHGALEDEKAILEGFGLPELPELQGSVRQKAWAYQERLALLSGLVAEHLWNANMPHLSDLLFDDALAARFGKPDENFGPEFKPLFVSLRSMINSGVLPIFWGTGDPSPTDRELVVLWLLVNDAVDKMSVFKEERARHWILMSKSRSLRLQYLPYRRNIEQFFAVKMVIATPGWVNPGQMLAAVEQMLSWSRDTDKGMVSVGLGMSLPDVLEQISVMRALEPRRMDFPF